MTVEVHVQYKEYHDIINTLPIYPDGTRHREDMWKAISEKCHIPLDCINYIILECDGAWACEVYPKM